MRCNAPTCWCQNEDYRVKWIPSLDISYTVDELSGRDNMPNSDNVRVFRYRYIERELHGEA